jgi:hypothetical protein
MTNAAAPKRELVRMPRPQQSRTYRIRLAAADVVRLTGAAQRRGSYPETLLEGITRTVLRDSLINAVLDDEPDGEHPNGGGRQQIQS